MPTNRSFPGRERIPTHIDDIRRWEEFDIPLSPDIPSLSWDINSIISRDLPFNMPLPFPTDTITEPVIVDKYYLWPDQGASKICYVSPRKMNYKKIHLDAFQELKENSLDIAKGILEIVVGIIDENFKKLNHTEERLWDKKLKDRGFKGYGYWNYKKLPVSTVRGKLTLGEKYLKHTIINDFNFGIWNPETEELTFRITLSQLGTVICKEALEDNHPESIPCIINGKISVGYPCNRFKLDSKYLTLSSSIGELNITTDSKLITFHTPEIKDKTIILVSGHHLIKYSMVEIKPNEGEGMIQQFGPRGGVHSKNWTTNTSDENELEWRVILHYLPTKWPEVNLSGKLLSNDFYRFIYIEPKNFIREISLIVLIMDENGNPLPHDDLRTKPYRVFCEIALKAEYIMGNGVLSSTMQLNSQETQTISLPKPPDKHDEKLQLTVTVFWNNETKIATKIIKDNEGYLLIKISHEAEISIENEEGH